MPQCSICGIFSASSSIRSWSQYATSTKRSSSSLWRLMTEVDGEAAPAMAAQGTQGDLGIPGALINGGERIDETQAGEGTLQQGPQARVGPQADCRHQGQHLPEHGGEQDLVAPHKQPPHLQRRRPFRKPAAQVVGPEAAGESAPFVLLPALLELPAAQEDERQPPVGFDVVGSASRALRKQAFPSSTSPSSCSTLPSWVSMPPSSGRWRSTCRNRPSASSSRPWGRRATARLASRLG